MGLIGPIHKNGDANKVNNYRGKTLLCTAYKIYGMILKERLERELDLKGVLLDTPAGVRVGRSTIDNVHISTHLVSNQKGRKIVYVVLGL